MILFVLDKALILDRLSSSLLFSKLVKDAIKKLNEELKLIDEEVISSK